MNNKQKAILDDLIIRYPKLEDLKLDIAEAFKAMMECFNCNKKLLVAGNGGSAADSDHIVGELMKGFKSRRSLLNEEKEKLEEVGGELGLELAHDLQGAFQAISLVAHNALNSAYLNDVDGLKCFAQQVYGYGYENDVFLGISTSGNSKNIIYAAITAKAKGMKVIGLTGKDGGKLKDYCDICLIAPETETFLIQELHLPIYHCLCLMVEAEKYDL